MSSIYEFVRQQRDDYRSQSITVAEGYDYSQYETLRTIELYHNSRFLTTNKDTLGREKPFYNICKFRVNVATRSRRATSSATPTTLERRSRAVAITCMLVFRPSTSTGRSCTKETGLTAA